MVSDTKTDSNTHTITISNLEEYIHEITKLGDHQNLYYRGQKDTFNNTLPSLFRNPKYLENENNLINDFITKNPELFVDCQNNFDRLALMQHHQLPTRLLDITNNSLVALYFAIEHGNEKKEPDGQIFLFQDSYNQDFLNFFLKKSNLNNINSEVTHKILRSAFSDQIDIESSLTRLNKEDREGFLNQLNIFYSSIDRHMENNNISWFNTYSDIRNNVDEKK